MKKFNQFYWMQIAGTALILWMWFSFFSKTVAPIWLWISLGLEAVSFIIYALPDPTDTQDGKDAGNWRVPVGVGLVIVGVFLSVVVFEVITSTIK